jgi:hypothetical protein
MMAYIINTTRNNKEFVIRSKIINDSRKEIVNLEKIQRTTFPNNALY